MNELNGTIVVFQGSKFFWRTRNTIDVTVVSHTRSNTTEVICYEPTIDTEATRIYLDSTILREKVDHDVEEAKANFAKQHNVSHTDKFVLDATHRAIADYVLNRLFLTQFSKETKVFAVQLQFNFRDRDLEYGGDSIDRMILAKPTTLAEHQTPHHRIITSEEVDAAIQALEEEQRNFRDEFVKVEALQTQTDVQLGIKERWRIPIVLGKVAQNRRLSGADRAIWEAMARNLNGDDDINKVAGVALRIVTAAPVAPGATASSAEQPSTPLSAPHQTPLPTPMQSPTMATTRLYTPKVVTQGRLFAGTVSSQNRVNAIEETHAKVHKSGRKFFKRGGGGGTKGNVGPSPKGKKSHHRAAKDRVQHDTPQAGADADEKLGFSADEDETTFVGQLATTLASIAASISGKFSTRATTRIHDRMHDISDKPETDTAAASAYVSAHNSMKKHTSVTCREIDDPAELSTRDKDQATLNPNLLASASTSSKKDYAPSRLGDCPAPLSNQRSLFRIGSSGASHTERSEDPDAAPQPDQELPRKRRSYFGSFLATFVRADSSANLGESASTAQEHQQGQSMLKKQPSRPNQLTFGETLTRLMSWRHHDQVLPAA